jgi:hypothetical protein
MNTPSAATSTTAIAPAKNHYVVLDANPDRLLSSRKSSPWQIDGWPVTRPSAEESVRQKVLRGRPYN